MYQFTIFLLNLTKPDMKSAGITQAEESVENNKINISYKEKQPGRDQISEEQALRWSNFLEMFSSRKT